MSNFTLSLNTTTAVFYTPHPGKPGPKGSRVAQSPQKEGDTCLYYALNTIRERVGKNPPSSLAKQREIEAIISGHRKLRTREQPNINHIRDFAAQISLMPEGCTRAVAKAFIKKADDLLSSEIPSKLKKLGIHALKNFVEQKEYDNFINYAESLSFKKDIEINMWLLKQFKIKPEEFLIDEKGSATISLKQQCMNLEATAVHLIFRVYRLERSYWHPLCPFEFFRQELVDYGPLVVNGKIGQAYYADRPEKVGKIKGRLVLGWKPGAKTRDLGITHCVTVIGAASSGKKPIVYFIDPLDGSDPKQPKKQKIYAMSYEKFILRVVNWNGKNYRSSKGDISTVDFHKDAENDYAVYAPRASLSSSPSSSSSSSMSSSMVKNS